MKATEVILRDHVAAKALFERFQAASGDDKEALEHQLFKALSAHEMMEDRYFYPKVKDKLGDDEVLKDLEHEQTTLKLGAVGTHMKETLLGPNDESVESVMDKVLAHAAKEESLLFPLVEESFTALELEDLGAVMEPHSAASNP
jgi:hemerythrin superfamily protein